jgi:hypothetical protein
MLGSIVQFKENILFCFMIVHKLIETWVAFIIRKTASSESPHNPSSELNSVGCFLFAYSFSVYLKKDLPFSS